MNSNRLQPTARPKAESELSQLIKSFSSALSIGNSADAVRAIDRAWRLAPKNPEICFLYGRQLLSQGAHAPAIKLLAAAIGGRTYPDYEAAYISALCLSGEIEAAQRRLEVALARYAVAAESQLAQAARQVATASAQHFPGWVAISPDLRLHGEIAGQSGLVKLEIAGSSGPPRHQRIKCEKDRPAAFVIPTDTLGPAHVTVRINDRLLLGGKLDIPPNFGLDGRISLAKGVFSGWVTMSWNPSWPLKLVISGANDFEIRVDARPDPTHLDRQIFSFDRALCEAAGNALSIHARMPDGNLSELAVSPFLIRTPRGLAMPPREPAPIRQTASPARPAIDIVIPVYSGVEETLTCIRSVIATAPDDAEIIVIEDASPDRDMAAALAPLAADGSITLLHNARNLGFPATANRGMRLHPDRDVVLLNSDTEVYGDWLTRMRNAASREPHIATVTPLTNSGSIASYPTSEEAAPTPQEAAALDSLAARTNSGITVDIPTAVGFCMYIKRRALDELGYFDDDLFAKGYGEENDFCLRSAKAGWTHVLAADVFVRHAGSRSFRGRRAALLDRNLRLLNNRYRGYDAAVQHYLKRDPAHRARRNLDEARLAAATRSYVLLVSLALDGGVFRAVQERLAAHRKAGLGTIILTPNSDKEGDCRLTVDEPGFDDLHYDFATEADALNILLCRLKLSHVELHHFLDLPPALIDSLFALNCPVDIKVHDYIWYCPRITLLNKAGRYCGEPDAAACQSCVDKGGSRLREMISIPALRERSAGWLRAARNVTAPSPSVARRMQAQFPGLAIGIESLESDIPAPVRFARKAKSAGNVKAALIGAIGDHKGYKILLAMARHAAKHDLPLEFVVIGFTQNDAALTRTGKVFITGRYDEDEAAGLIARENPDVVLFLSVFPESWCYTLTHALRAKVPVAAYDLGAIADRLRGTAADDLLFPLSAGPADLCNRLLLAFPPVTSFDHNKNNSLSRRTGPSGLTRKADIVAPAPTLPDAAITSRTSMAPTSTDPTASVSFLPLPEGLYLFSVRSGTAAPRIGEQITLPAMQVSAAPGTPAGHIEFLMSTATTNGWLINWNDQIVAKVTGSSVLVSMTSVLIPGMTPLEIEVQRLDQPKPASTPAAMVSRPGLPPLSSGQKSLPLEVTAHVQNRGDLTFKEGEWAGQPDQRLWIESIAITPLEGISPDAIEYKAITATGVETPWVSDGAPCGTRGIGVPITGFALRIKPQAGLRQLTCEYGAVCVSGATIGPVRNGAPCYSADSSDPITGMWVAITGEVGPAAKVSSMPAKKSEASKEHALASGAAAKSAVKSKKAKIGPRFSVFRESNPSDQE
jgi:GT2 family glycosyltransferase